MNNLVVDNPKNTRDVCKVLVDIAHFMEHPMAHAFYNKYMVHPSTRNQVVYLLFMYDALTRKMPHISAYEKLDVLYDLIQHRTLENNLNKRKNLLQQNEHISTKPDV